MPVDLNSFGDFGRYRLIRRISLGGMAEVFKAKSYNSVGFEKVVALKRLLPQVGEDDNFVQMLIQESQIAARLDHPNICRIYELGEHEGHYYLTMEFIYGYDLRQVFKAVRKLGRQMDPWVVAWIGAQVAEALDYAYRRTDAEGRVLHLVHRDISPQNVMLGFDGAVKVIDFGIAKVANATVQTAAGVLKGKYAYMSPQHASNMALDERSDIWSLGVVMHELLAGRRLFMGGSMADTVEQVLHAPVPPLEDVHPALADCIQRMLARDLTHRYESHAAVLADLQEYLSTRDEPVTQRALSAWMETVFPRADRFEADLTEDDMRLVFSAEELGEETTDVRSDVSAATRIFLADATGQADYRVVLERLLAQGQVQTAVTQAERGPEGSLGGEALDVANEASVPVDASRTDLEGAVQTLRDALFSAAAFSSLVWLLLRC